MPWNGSKKLIQLQADPEVKAQLQKLAQEDKRSLASEIVWLITLGVEMRAKMEKAK
jgi:hypothetical protein